MLCFLPFLLQRFPFVLLRSHSNINKHFQLIIIIFHYQSFLYGHVSYTWRTENLLEEGKKVAFNFPSSIKLGGGGLSPSSFKIGGLQPFSPSFLHLWLQQLQWSGTHDGQCSIQYSWLIMQTNVIWQIFPILWIKCLQLSKRQHHCTCTEPHFT